MLAQLAMLYLTVCAIFATALLVVSIPIGGWQIVKALRSRRTRRSSPRHMRGTLPQPGRESL